MSLAGSPGRCIGGSTLGEQMALQGPIPVEFGAVFSHGAFAAGGFEPVRDFDASSGDRFVQAKDKATGLPVWVIEDRKSTRLNSSHRTISYAVFCLKKKK